MTQAKAMTKERRAEIMTALESGGVVHRQWVGGPRGHLEYTLVGVLGAPIRLRASEYFDLLSELEFIQPRGSYQYASLKLRAS